MSNPTSNHNIDDEIAIKLIIPSGRLPPDEVTQFGMIRFRYMSREEFEKTFPKSHRT